MTKETKVLLLVGIAFVTLFAIILSEKALPAAPPTPTAVRIPKPTPVPNSRILLIDSNEQDIRNTILAAHPGDTIRLARDVEIPLTKPLAIEDKYSIVIEGPATFVRHQVAVNRCANVRLRHLRFRSCDGFSSDADRTAVNGPRWHDPNVCGWRSLLILDSSKVVVENCSVEDSCDDNMNVWGDSRGTVLFRCIFAGGYCFTPGGQGLLVGTDAGTPPKNYPDYVVIQQCLFSNLNGRGPDLHGGVFHVINNVIAKPIAGGRLFGFTGNIQRNWLITMRPHPWTTPDQLLCVPEFQSPSGAIYAEGNFLDGQPSPYPVGVMNKGTSKPPSGIYRQAMYATPQLPALIYGAQTARDEVIQHAGCMPRDAQDTEFVKAANAN